MPKKLFKNITKRQKLFGLGVIITLITIMGVALYMRAPELFNPSLQLGDLTARHRDARQGCAYKNPPCFANENCIDNECQTKSGCAYNNPMCNPNQTCKYNQCVTRKGCAYDNPSCNSDQICKNNICHYKIGCEYDNPSCNEDQDCMNNQCVTKQGCTYKNPPCGYNHDCVNNVCQTKKCTDGTDYGQCSNEQPKYCNGGNLINKCSFCGCPSGNQCQPDRSCIQPYEIDFGDPSFFKPELYTGTWRVPIMCKKNNETYYIEDCGAKIAQAYAYIKDSTGNIIQKFDLTLEMPARYKGTFDYNSLTGESYTLGIYAEDTNGMKKDISNYSFFSGQGWNLCNTNSECQQYHSCVNNKCMLDTVNYKLALVYIYNNADTYNPNWQTEFKAINQKVINGIKESTDYKVNPTIDVLGEVQTDIFCWNPGAVGGKWRNTLGDEFYFKMPGSDFSSPGIGLTGWEILDSYCDNCIADSNLYKMNCKDDLTYSNLWESDRLSRLNKQISEKLGFSFDDYDGVFIIFGKLGQVIHQENDINLQYRCSGFSGYVGGYSNLIMGENTIKSGGLIPCNTQTNIQTPFYDPIGWHKMVHEILHRIGAVDVYDTGTVFGYDPTFYRNRARLIDQMTDKSIMGNEERECIDEGGYENDGDVCTQQELDAIYLDKYNKQKIGINP